MTQSQLSDLFGASKISGLPVLTLLTLAVTTIGSLISFGVILTQFIGAKAQTLEKLAFIQIACLVIAILLALFVYIRASTKSNKNVSVIKDLFITMPGWLIFILLLLFVTALLGDLSVLLARLSGHELTNLFHLPSICITIFCLIYALINYDLTANNHHNKID